MEQTNSHILAQDLPAHLQQELVKRCQKNSSYSLRSFAQSLGVSHASLSQIINRKRPVSEKMILKLASPLELSPAQIQHFKTSLNLANSKGVPQAYSNDYLKLAEDKFTIISEWQHFAILELMETSQFKADPKLISKQLGLSLVETKASIERLERLNLIKINNLKWELAPDTQFLSVTDRVNTSGARKKYLRSCLEKSMAALENTPIDKRSHSGITMAIDSSKINDAKTLIQNFRREMQQLLSGSEQTQDQVYHMQIGLFPLTKEFKNTGDNNE